MSIDTHIPGDPDSIARVVRWLGGVLGDTLGTVSESIERSRRTIDSAWDGMASDQALSRVESLAQVASERATAARATAAAVQRFADDLRSQQQQMAHLRAEAIAAGLTVVDETIFDTLPDALDESVRHKRVDALESLSRAACAVQDQRRRSLEELVGVWDEHWGAALLTVMDLVGSGLESLAASRAGALHAASTKLAQDAARLLEEASAAAPGSPAGQVYRSADIAQALSRSADDAAAAAERLLTRVARAGAVLGGATTVLGIGLDMENGESAAQAVSSGTVGLGATIAAGAAMGSFVPVAGTLGGALIGMGVGIAASGAVDGMFTDGVSGIVPGAVGALSDTVTAVGDLAEEVWDAVF